MDLPSVSLATLPTERGNSSATTGSTWYYIAFTTPVCSQSSRNAYGTIASGLAISFASRVVQEATRRPRQLMDGPRPCSSTLSPVALGTECRTLSAKMAGLHGRELPEIKEMRRRVDTIKCLIRIAYGFRNINTLISFVMLFCSRIKIPWLEITSYSRK